LREGLKEQIITEEQMVQLSQLAAKVSWDKDNSKSIKNAKD
jgi:hypothetical protein